MKVYKAINAIQSELVKTGIVKDRNNAQQGYKFRGIDDVFNALSPLLAKHGLVITPKYSNRRCEVRESKNGGVLFSVTIDGEFAFTCAEDCSAVTVCTVGEAMDSGDKATNKAMSAAYKYAAVQAFAIPTEADNDPDATTHELAHMAQYAPTIEKLAASQSLADLQKAWSGLTKAERDVQVIAKAKDARKRELAKASKAAA